MKYESNTPMFSKDMAREPFSYKIKGHNSDNNRWVLSLIDLDLYFIIIYLCMNYESNTPMHLKRYGQETIFSYKIKGHNSDNNRWVLSLIELDLYFMIIYL